MRWEALVMVVILGAINLIGRWMAARAERRKREASASAGETRAPVGASKQALAQRPTVVRAPREARLEPTGASREAPSSSMPQPKPPKPLIPGTAREALIRAAAVAPSPKARNPARLWSSKAVRQAFIASEILAKPASLRT